jgi:MarR family transcriptional regulator, lower aerobic nicotinate degradation pathway regulator
MPPTVSELGSHLGYWLRQVSNHVSHAFALKLAAKDVTVAEWALMRMLYGEKALSPSRLADDMGLTRGAITKLADRLIAKSLIVRQASPDDGRAQTLALTKTGTAFVPDLAALADHNEIECFAHLSTNERRRLQQVLRKTAKHLGLTAAPLD